MSTPIFIFSLPRSGSTLLQKIISRNNNVKSIAEPWLLLPIVGMLGSPNIDEYSNYSSKLLRIAINDLEKELVGTSVTVESVMEEAIRKIYDEICKKGGEKYFLDKTPRYYLIIDAIAEMFPDAKFIFVYRSPLEIIASMIKTWGRERLWLHHYHVDLFVGGRLLSHGYLKHKKRSLLVRYQDLTLNPESSIKEVCNYLELRYSQGMIDDYSSVNFKGEMGDPTGIKQYKDISTSSLEKWKPVINNPVRVRYVKKVILNIKKDYVEAFNYDYDYDLKRLNEVSIGFKYIFSDIVAIVISYLSRTFLISLILRNLKKRTVRNRCKLS